MTPPITAMTRQTIKPITEDAELALQMVADQYGLTLTRGPGRFSGASLTVKFTFACSTEDGIPVDFARLAPRYDLTAAAFAREFTPRTGTYRITGLVPRRRTYPVLPRRPRHRRPALLPPARLRQPPEGLQRRGPDRGERLGHRFDTRPVQIDEIPGVAHHVRRCGRQQFDDLDGAVGGHQVSDMDVADVTDADAVEGPRPASGHDLLLRNLNALGMMAAIELEPRPGEPTMRATEMFRRCFDAGLLIRTTGDVLALSPPLIIDADQTGQIVDTIGKGMQSIK